MARRRVTPPVQAWMAQMLSERVSPDTIAAELLKRGYSLASIREGLEVPANWDALAALEIDRDLDYDAIADVALALDPAGKIATDKLQIYKIENYLGDADCDALMRLIDSRLRPSAIDLDKYGTDIRTSRTCDLDLLHQPLVAEVDAKIANTLRIPLAKSELMQGQRYDVGQQFKEHADFFEPGTPVCAQFAGVLGNRTWTFMIYLNDVDKGGGTCFPAIDMTFMPRKGSALAWNNLNRDGTVNFNAIHAGRPVEAGHKVVITKWFREKAAS